MQKKASEGIWWVIAGAVIVLVVIVVLLTIFAGGSNKASKGFLDCASKGGVCVESKEICIEKKGTLSGTFTCGEESQICCFGVSG